MSYGGSRDSERLARLQLQVDAFAGSYDRAKRTIFFFPAGLGSQLLRAFRPFDQPQTGYYVSWLHRKIFTGEAKNLPFLTNGDDVDQHYIIPEGAVDYLVHPYKRFTKWCAGNDLQLFVFAYDWRR